MNEPQNSNPVVVAAAKPITHRVTLVRGKTSYVKGVRFERNVPIDVSEDVAAIASTEVDTVSFHSKGEAAAQEGRARFTVQVLEGAETDVTGQEGVQQTDAEAPAGTMKTGWENANPGSTPSNSTATGANRRVVAQPLPASPPITRRTVPQPVVPGQVRSIPARRVVGQA